MKLQWQTLVPTTKHDAVVKALQSTFGTTNVEEIAPLTGGGSPAIVLRFVVNTLPYVLRIVQQINPLNDPVRQLACLNIASEAGISPRVHYADAGDAVAITDFIAPVPLREYPGPLLIGIVDAIKAIQSAPLFPPLAHSMDLVDRFIEQFRSLETLPERATREHFACYARIQEVYPRHDTDLVSSHNDLNPRNILFDGKRLWVVDWDTAFRNDRYADLASVANFFFRDEPDEEETLLRAYFGDTLDEYRRARFFLMRQVSHMAYAMLLLLSATAGQSAWDKGMETPRMFEFRRRFVPGASEGDPLASAEGRLLYGKVWLNEALHHMKTPRFEEAIRSVRNAARLNQAG